MYSYSYIFIPGFKIAGPVRIFAKLMKTDREINIINLQFPVMIHLLIRRSHFGKILKVLSH